MRKANKKRNPFAKHFKKQIIKSKKIYNRKKTNEFN